MDRQHTQFWVAIIGMAGLVAITAMAVAGLGSMSDELTFLLVGGLLSTTATAAAWLFRLNGTGKK